MANLFGEPDEPIVKTRKVKEEKPEGCEYRWKEDGITLVCQTPRHRHQIILIDPERREGTLAQLRNSGQLKE